MTSPVHHESSDVSLGSIVGFAGGLVFSALVISVLVWVLFQFLSGQATRRGSTAEALTVKQPVPPSPRLQTDPRGDLLDLREAEERALTTYGWVDRNAGIVRIPIEQAMRLTVERGLLSNAPREAPRR
jgi:hypothetical protein